MNDRIQLILKTKNISASKFADEIGVQRSSISHIISGRNNPSLDFIQKIIKRFPDINSDWLIFGKGTMYKEQDLFSGFDDPKNEKSKLDDQIQQPQEGISNENDNEIIENQHGNEASIENSIKETILQPSKKIKIVSESASEVNKPVSLVKTPLRKIERIIIFYSDKTCTEYKIE